MLQSIIIPFHKDKDMLLFSLQTLFQTVKDIRNIEIIIVGNNRNKCELNFDIPYQNVNFIKIYDNLFYPKAVNLGVSKAHGEIITICDPDIFYLTNWYEPLLNKIEEPNVGAVGNKLINPCNGRILDFGVYYSKFNAIHSLYGAKKDHPLAHKDRKVQSVCSAVIMTKKSIFEKVQGMDNDLPFAYTDFDYCLKIIDLGYDIWVLGNSEVYHKGSTDSNNSKYYAFSYLRTDCKGIFYANAYSKIKFDYPTWFSITANEFKKEHPKYEKKFFMLDLTTLYDKDEFYSVIKNVLEIQFLDIEVIDIQQRNKKEINLHQAVKFNLIECTSPILYFVDVYTSLFDNDLWFNFRDISNDLVIDRSGNIYSMEEIKKRCC